MDIDRLKENYPEIQVVHGVKYVDSFPVITSGGISAGINMPPGLISLSTLIIPYEKI
jgi:transcriptional regulator GlxA family with amidase domain